MTLPQVVSRAPFVDAARLFQSGQNRLRSILGTPSGTFLAHLVIGQVRRDNEGEAQQLFGCLKADQE
jgi:hypothetical protein